MLVKIAFILLFIRSVIQLSLDQFKVKVKIVKDLTYFERIIDRGAYFQFLISFVS